jgi:Ndc80 complex Nuf2 component-like protein
VQELKEQCDEKQKHIHELNSTQRDNMETINQLKVQREVVRSEIVRFRCCFLICLQLTRWTHTHTHTHKCTNNHTYTHAYTYTHPFTFPCSFLTTAPHSSTLVDYVYLHTRTQTNTHTHTHTHTQGVEVEDIVALEQQINMLEAQVVPPPEKMREHLAQLAARVEREKEEIRLADQKLHESLRRLENLGRVEKEVAKNAALIQECMEERSKSKKFRTDIKTTEKKIHCVEEKLRELDTNQQHNLRKVDLAREKIQRLKTRRQNEITQARQALRAAREEQSSTERRVAGTQNEIEQSEGARRNAENKIRLIEKEHEREMNDMAQRYERLRAHVDQYHEHLFRAMEQPMSA